MKLQLRPKIQFIDKVKHTVEMKIDDNNSISDTRFIFIENGYYDSVDSGHKHEFKFQLLDDVNYQLVDFYSKFMFHLSNHTEVLRLEIEVESNIDGLIYNNLFLLDGGETQISFDIAQHYLSELTVTVTIKDDHDEDYEAKVLMSSPIFFADNYYEFDVIDSKAAKLTYQIKDFENFENVKSSYGLNIKFKLTDDFAKAFRFIENNVQSLTNLINNSYANILNGDGQILQEGEVVINKISEINNNQIIELTLFDRKTLFFQNLKNNKVDIRWMGIDLSDKESRENSINKTTEQILVDGDKYYFALVPEKKMNIYKWMNVRNEKGKINVKYYTIDRGNPSLNGEISDDNPSFTQGHNDYLPLLTPVISAKEQFIQIHKKYGFEVHGDILDDLEFAALGLSTQIKRNKNRYRNTKTIYHRTTEFGNSRTLLEDETYGWANMLCQDLGWGNTINTTGYTQESYSVKNIAGYIYQDNVATLTNQDSKALGFYHSNGSFYKAETGEPLLEAKNVYRKLKYKLSDIKLWIQGTTENGATQQMIFTITDTFYQGREGSEDIHMNSFLSYNANPASFMYGLNIYQDGSNDDFDNIFEFDDIEGEVILHPGKKWVPRLNANGLSPSAGDHKVEYFLKMKIDIEYDDLGYLYDAKIEMSEFDFIKEIIKMFNLIPIIENDKITYHRYEEYFNNNKIEIDEYVDLNKPVIYNYNINEKYDNIKFETKLGYDYPNNIKDDEFIHREHTNHLVGKDKTISFQNNRVALFTHERKIEPFIESNENYDKIYTNQIVDDSLNDYSVNYISIQAKMDKLTFWYYPEEYLQTLINASQRNNEGLILDNFNDEKITNLELEKDKNVWCYREHHNQENIQVRFYEPASGQTKTIQSQGSLNYDNISNDFVLFNDFENADKYNYVTITPFIDYSNDNITSFAKYFYVENNSDLVKIELGAGSSFGLLEGDDMVKLEHIKNGINYAHHKYYEDIYFENYRQSDNYNLLLKNLKHNDIHELKLYIKSNTELMTKVNGGAILYYKSIPYIVKKIDDLNGEYWEMTLLSKFAGYDKILKWDNRINSIYSPDVDCGYYPYSINLENEESVIIFGTYPAGYDSRFGYLAIIPVGVPQHSSIRVAGVGSKFKIGKTYTVKIMVLVGINNEMEIEGYYTDGLGNDFVSDSHTNLETGDIFEFTFERTGTNDFLGDKSFFVKVKNDTDDNLGFGFRFIEIIEH